MHGELLLDPASAMAVVVVVGVLGQWLGWRLQVPAILPLLLFGLGIGPAAGLLDPDAVFGDLLLPMVSLAVALVLFEGGLSLKIGELRGIGRVVWGLLTVGVVVNGAIIGAAAHFLAGLEPGRAALLGAVLVVTGPTVIGPLLRQVRPRGELSSILRWEGIVVDPIGAVLAVLVFEAVAAPDFTAAAQHAVIALARAALAGVALGAVAGLALVELLRHSRVPEYLHAALTLMLALAALTSANLIQDEAGLIAVTVMGIALANQRRVDVKHILQFNESVGVVIIAVLFVVLTARVDLDQIRQVGWGAAAFLLVVLLVARPVSVWLSTLGSGMGLREKLLLSFIAPRGIVAAAVSSVFALALAERSGDVTGPLVPLTFLVIGTTVVLNSLGARPLARALGLSESDPQGFLIVGAHDWAIELARLLQRFGVRCLLIDNNPHHIAAAGLRGVQARTANVLAHDLPDRLDLSGIGRLLALTPNDEVNSLACLHFDELFGDQVYQLAEPEGRVTQPAAAQLRGQTLFSATASSAAITEQYGQGSQFKATSLTDAFGWDDYQKLYGDRLVPMFLADATTHRIDPIVAGEPPRPRSGQTVISLVWEA